MIMIYTSASANKMIKILEDRKEYLLQQESNNSQYVLAEDERADIPEYSFVKTNAQVDEIDVKIRKLKHALNVFNSTTVLPIGITIDQALVEMAQLNRKLPRLDTMRRQKTKTRLTGYNAARRDVAEYQYLNYRPLDVDKVYEENLKRVQTIQLALDKINQTAEFEVDVEE
ncbi:MAG: hypothetical protein IIZ48_00935 [Erysipelotrichales bacterium]|nr:hypothetical protein [Erysipelotrichales bacterium]